MDGVPARVTGRPRVGRVVCGGGSPFTDSTPGSGMSALVGVGVWVWLGGTYRFRSGREEAWHAVGS